MTPQALASSLASLLHDNLTPSERQRSARGLAPQGSGDLVTWAGQALLALTLRDLGNPHNPALRLSRAKGGTVALAFALQALSLADAK